MLAKIKTYLWYALLIFFMLLCLFALPVYLLGKWLLPPQRYLKMTLFARYFWGRVVVRSTGSKVSFEGLENIPTSTTRQHSVDSDSPSLRLCYVGNHQSYFDIPAFLGWSGQPVGFIAKQELLRVPILSQWMRIINCVFIDRSNPRSAIESFKESAKVINAGFPQIIFPEGTRSKGENMGPFHIGSLKLASMADAAIVPFAIKGSYRAYEIDGHIHRARIKIRLLEPILTDDPIYHDKLELAEQIRSRIAAALEEM
ncbi:MAG: 1-acyl-sn-glycerol-3-phosphate acyltransferase [Candidatus Cloacimonetes bacterium]|nr:1-acyl-sn-glycerol-3-phosphate acyltransferase [Candidatus Cloacimonadota bacterium]HNZ07023.1 lysophospholipid acyltransferase family protein [Candidatus Cloacimonadota bacterium]